MCDNKFMNSNIVHSVYCFIKYFGVIFSSPEPFGSQ